MRTTLFFCFILFTAKINAQVGYTRTEITDKFGTAYFKTGVSKIGEPYVIYKMPDSSATNGVYTKTMGFYFKKGENGTEYCNEQLIMEPMTETKKWVDYFSGKYEKISKQEWKDTTNKIIFRVSIIDEQCAVRIWYE